MEQAAIIITPAQGSELSQLSKVLSEYQILHLPVVDVEGKQVGLVTQDSLLRALNISAPELVSPSENQAETQNSLPSLKTTNLPTSESSQFQILLQKRLVDILLSDSETALIASVLDQPQLHSIEKVATLTNSQTTVILEKQAAEPVEKFLIKACLEKIGKAIMITDKIGLIIYCNQIAAHLYNKPKEELLNQPIEKILLTLNTPLTEEKITEFLETKENWETETIIQRPEGDAIIAHLTSSVIKDISGEIIGTIHTCTDISDKKQIEQSLKESQEEIKGLLASIKQGQNFSVSENKYPQPGPEKNSSLNLTSLPLLPKKNDYFNPNFKTLIGWFNPFLKTILKESGLGQDQNCCQANSTVLCPKVFSGKRKISEDSALTEATLLAKQASVNSLANPEISSHASSKDSLVLLKSYQNQQQLQQLMEATGAIIYTAEIYGNYLIKTLSPNSVTIMGYEPQEFIENPHLWVSRIHPEDHYKIEKEILNSLKQKRSVEYRFLCKDGNYCWLRDEAQLIFDSTGTAIEIMGTCQNISQQKMLEEQAQKAYQKEKELSSLHRQFITMTSHEFRTPLCTILSSADLLELYIERGRTEKQKEHIDRIQASALRINNLLNDILATGKGIAGQIKCNPTRLNLEEFCHKIIEKTSLSMSVFSERIQFIKTGNCAAAALDETLIEQILLNLLSNAVKYTWADSPIVFELICLDAEETLEQPRRVVFKIQDFGIGIPSDDIPHIFDAFYRGSNLNNQGGTGLGLTIVKQAADAHKAEINLESVVGVGTTFTVSVPVCTVTTT